MKIGDKIDIAGEKFNVLFMYEDYILACLDSADAETMANGTFVFQNNGDNKLTMIKDKEKIKLVITKLFELAQSKK